MTKRALIGITSLFMVAQSVAFSGLYIGSGLGSDTVAFKKSAHVYSPGNFNVMDKTNHEATGIFGTFFAGYSYLYQRFYVAAEANGNVSSNAFNSSNVETNHGTVSGDHYAIKNLYGFSALPGFQYSPNTLFYGRLGYAKGYIRAMSSDRSTGDFNTHLNGFRYGLGIKQALTQHIAIRADYSRVNYGAAHNHTFDPIGNVTKNTAFTPHQQLMELALIYQF